MIGKYSIIDLILKVFTTRLRVYVNEQDPIKKPDKYRTYFSYNSIPDAELDDTFNMYKEVYTPEPWLENWEKEEVLKILKYGLKRDGVLTLMDGDTTWAVGGLSLCKIIPTSKISKQILIGLKGVENDKAKLETFFEEFFLDPNEDILYYFEFAILEDFRSGTDPIRFLFREGLEFAFSKGIKKALFWSTPNSKIVPLASFMGFRPIGSINVGNKKIIFLFNKNIIPVLKIAQNIPASTISKFMGLASKV